MHPVILGPPVLISKHVICRGDGAESGRSARVVRPGVRVRGMSLATVGPHDVLAGGVGPDAEHP